MELVEQYIDPSRYAKKCPYIMNNPIGITIHNTANSATARQEVAYMQRNDQYTSWHIAIDENEVVKAIPFNRNSWHCGDGNGDGNRRTISIEICRSTHPDINLFLQAERNTAIYVAMLMKEYNFNINQIYKHQSWSNKYCPHKTLDLGWDRFLNMVKEEFDKLNKPVALPVENIPDKTVKLICDTSLWDVNCQNIYQAKPIKQYKEGDLIDVVDIITSPYGVKYYRTEYTADKGLYYGFNVGDCVDYVEEVKQPEKPIQTPEKTDVKDTVEDIEEYKAPVKKWWEILIEFILDLFKKK